MKRLIWLFPLLLSFSINAGAAASAYVQSTGTMQVGTGSVAATFVGNTTAHNKIFVYFLCFGTVSACNAAPLTVTDTLSITYQAAATFNQAAAYSLFIWESTSDTPGGADTVTISATALILEGGASEYSGFAPTGAAFDKTAGAATNDSGATATTTSANEMLLGWGYNNTGTPTAGAGYTVRASAGPDQVLRFEDKHVTSTGTYNATFTGTMRATMIATFKDQSQGSPQPGGFQPGP